MQDGMKTRLCERRDENLLLRFFIYFHFEGVTFHVKDITIVYHMNYFDVFRTITIAHNMMFSQTCN